MMYRNPGASKLRAPMLDAPVQPTSGAWTAAR